MKILYIIRGPSGTGKSTIAKTISERLAIGHSWPDNSPPVFEADDFWGPDYDWNAKFIGDAHRWCQLNVMREMISKTPFIIVSNTFIRTRDIRPYFELADQFDYELKIIRTPGPWDAEVLAKRNIHNVPQKTIEKWIRNYEEHPAEVEWSDLSIFKEE